MTNATKATTERSRARVVTFVDYWNFQLTVNHKEARLRGQADWRAKIDWKGIGPTLAELACGVANIDPDAYSFEGTYIYTSFNPNNAEGKKFSRWVNSWLNRQPGVHVECREREPKSLPKCPSCYEVIDYCPKEDCGKKIEATTEKGVDTLLATDMIRLAWEEAYDIAILASSDSDLVPAVEFLHSKARKIIQAGFPPLGVSLATACWASFDVFKAKDRILRA